MTTATSSTAMAASDPKKDGAQTRKIDSSATAPRKRRKRTAGGGAADDCFTCASRGTKCDRRRPYCSQCLELGRDCSGYKTTLTWGVGVASRGKLRGLSLPVSGGLPVGAQKRRTSTAQEEDNKVRKRQNGQPSPNNTTSQSDVPTAIPSAYQWPGPTGNTGSFAGVYGPAGWIPGVSVAPVTSSTSSYQVNTGLNGGLHLFSNCPSSV
jgi:hypothetical protein